MKSGSIFGKTPLMALACAVLASCSSAYKPGPAPNIYIQPASNFGTATVDASASVDGELLFVTDRGATDENDAYGFERSPSMAFGTVRVGIENMTELSFDAYSRGNGNKRARPRFVMFGAEEHGRFPGTPLPFSIVDGVMSPDQQTHADYRAVTSSFKSELTQRLKAEGTGDVLLYIHGFNNTFAEAAYSLFELWHYSGRSTVPVMFNWPTGRHKVLGYLGDTEDGEYSIFHLKETIRMLSATEGVERIFIVAHSRGASLTTTALRELLIEARGSGISARDTFKVDTLIMAAPDIDLGVMEQRLVAEAFGLAFKQINVYVNPNDNALGVSSFIFGGTRFGAMTPDSLSDESRAVFAGVKSVSFILVDDVTGSSRHSYFRLHPGVLADIAVTLNTGASPGSAERPLSHLDLNFWQIDKTYVPRIDVEENKAD